MTTFVCLMQDKEIERQGTHYFEIAKSLVTKSPKDYRQKPNSLRLIHFPIKGTECQKILPE